MYRNINKKIKQRLTEDLSDLTLVKGDKSLRQWQFCLGNESSMMCTWSPVYVHNPDREWCPAGWKEGQELTLQSNDSFLFVCLFVCFCFRLTQRN